MAKNIRQLKRDTEAAMVESMRGSDRMIGWLIMATMAAITIQSFVPIFR